MTPYGKPHKWIAHFLHMLTNYQWCEHSIRGDCSSDQLIIAAAADEAGYHLKNKWNFLLFLIQVQVHETACGKKGWHKAEKEKPLTIRKK